MTDDLVRGTIKKCPRCGGEKIGYDPVLQVAGYGPGLAVCIACECMWEPFDLNDQLDAEEPHSSFKKPCNNCAFRKGSNEQRNPAKWRALLDKLMLGGTFFCHKGVPLAPKSDDGFEYPRKTIMVDFAGEQIETTVYEVMNMRLCRGYLDRMYKLRAAGKKKVKAGKLDALAILGDPGE